MSTRYELVSGDCQGWELCFYLRDDECLMRSTRLVPAFAAALPTVTWLRSALAKDWCYRIGRHRGGGPMFYLDTPTGIRCTSASFRCADAMERAIAVIRVTCQQAPIVLRPSDAREPGIVIPHHDTLESSVDLRQVTAYHADRRRGPFAASHEAGLASRAGT